MLKVEIKLIMVFDNIGSYDANLLCKKKYLNSVDNELNINPADFTKLNKINNNDKLSSPSQSRNLISESNTKRKRIYAEISAANSKKRAIDIEAKTGCDKKKM